MQIERDKMDFIHNFFCFKVCVAQGKILVGLPCGDTTKCHMVLYKCLCGILYDDVVGLMVICGKIRTLTLC